MRRAAQVNKAFVEFVNLCQRSPEFISLAMDHYLRGAKAGKQPDAAATTEEQAPDGPPLPPRPLAPAPPAKGPAQDHEKIRTREAIGNLQLILGKAIRRRRPFSNP